MYRLHDEAYYDEISAMTEEKLSALWEETDFWRFNYMLEVLPPIRKAEKAFMVGECVTLGLTGALYDAYVTVDNRFFWRPGYIQKFNPITYTKEIRAKFYEESPCPA
jgi:hypothetical protein